MSADNFAYVIPEEAQDMRHSQEAPFCPIFIDPTCPCREDPILIAEVAAQVEEGLLTSSEATRVTRGEQI